MLFEIVFIDLDVIYVLAFTLSSNIRSLYIPSLSLSIILFFNLFALILVNTR